jgi:ankyrin repeat protein
VHFETVRLLLSAGAHTEQLHVEAYHGIEGGIQIVHWLLRAGAHIEGLAKVADFEDRTPLMVAAGAGKPRMVAALLSAGADVDARVFKPHSGDTPLHCAARLTSTYRYQWPAPHPDEAAYNAWTVVRLLLTAGADVHAVNREQQAPLSVAAGCANRAVVHLLLEAGAAVNKVCGYAGTPLHAAATGSRDHPSGCDLTVRALLGAGADPGARSVLAWPAATGPYTYHRSKPWKGTTIKWATAT